MKVRKMILPFGDALVCVPQKIGKSPSYGWYLYHYKNEDMYISVMNKKSRNELFEIAEKHNWIIDID